MKIKEFAIVLALSIIIFAGLASAVCDVSVKLLNQDPYPAVPGEYVKVVFQVDGTENSDCGKVFFDIIPSYPFSLEANSSKVVESSTYILGYPSFWLAGYKLRVDKDALDGENNITVKYSTMSNPNSYTFEDFNINVEEARTDFDVILQDYSSITNTITFAIVNIGKKNAEALTLELPGQANIKALASSKVVIGSLNANDDTTATIKAMPLGEGEVNVRLSYNDANGVRREIDKKVFFTQALINKDNAQATPKGNYYYLFWAIVVIAIAYFGYGYYQKRKAKNNKIALMKR